MEQDKRQEPQQVTDDELPPLVVTRWHTVEDRSTDWAAEVLDLDHPETAGLVRVHLSEWSDAEPAEVDAVTVRVLREARRRQEQADG